MRPAVSALFLALAGSVLTSALLTGSPAAASTPGYRPAEPPVLQRDPAGDAGVLRQRLARTDLTRREARAADFTRVRYSVVDHDGERSARIEVRLRRVLPNRPKRHVQIAKTYFDEETFVDTVVRTGTSRYRSSSGGAGSQAPGCRRLDAERVGTTLTQWIPVRCLVSDSSEMYVNSGVYAVQPDTEAGRRLVGSDGAPRNAPFVRWR